MSSGGPPGDSSEDAFRATLAASLAVSPGKAAISESGAEGGEHPLKSPSSSPATPRSFPGCPFEDDTDATRAVARAAPPEGAGSPQSGAELLSSPSSSPSSPRSSPRHPSPGSPPASSAASSASASSPPSLLGHPPAMTLTPASASDGADAPMTFSSGGLSTEANMHGGGVSGGAATDLGALADTASADGGNSGAGAGVGAGGGAISVDSVASADSEYPMDVSWGSSIEAEAMAISSDEEDAEGSEMEDSGASMKVKESGAVVTGVLAAGPGAPAPVPGGGPPGEHLLRIARYHGVSDNGLQAVPLRAGFDLEDGDGVPTGERVVYEGVLVEEFVGLDHRWNATGLFEDGEVAELSAGEVVSSIEAFDAQNPGRSPCICTIPFFAVIRAHGTAAVSDGDVEFALRLLPNFSRDPLLQLRVVHWVGPEDADLDRQPLTLPCAAERRGRMRVGMCLGAAIDRPYSADAVEEGYIVIWDDDVVEAPIERSEMEQHMARFLDPAYGLLPISVVFVPVRT